MKTATVWPVPVMPSSLEHGAHIGTHCLSAVCDLGVLIWTSDMDVPARVEAYDCLIVNLFEGMNHVTAIKERYPNVFVIALPDNSFDQVFTHSSKRDILFLQQLQAADAIGYISESNFNFYSAIFPTKCFIKIPMPIGGDDFFADVREQDKDDFIITCDHAVFDEGRTVNPRTNDYCIQNVAAVAAIQRKTGLPVTYINTSPKTRDYAKFAGLEATFHGYVSLDQYAQLAATARLGVDMYTLHGFGRNTLMYAACGTPAFGSAYTEFAGSICDPWNPQDALNKIDGYLNGSAIYETARISGLKMVEHFYSFDACRKQMTDLLEQVDIWRHLPHPSLHGSA